MKDAYTGTQDKLEKDLQALIRDTKDLLKTTAENVTGEAAELRRRVEERLEGLQKSAGHKVQATEDLLKEGMDAAAERIREYPYQAMGVSLAVGILLGMFFHRRR